MKTCKSPLIDVCAPYMEALFLSTVSRAKVAVKKMTIASKNIL